ncbi:MAG: tRNA pseudouridine(13) synthase TruD [Candidatus Nanoarchaeia archaeon]
MKIKQIPEDFLVEEIINIPIEKNGNQSYFWLIKKNWTTEGAISEISKRSKIKYRRFKFAGSKDKKAVTKQAISVFKIEPKKLLNLKIKDIKLEFIGYGNKPISIGSLNGNKFTITLRNLKKKEIQEIKKKLEKIKNGFKNYFGFQRFGRGNTAKIGKEILKGNLERAVKEIICFISENESSDKKNFRKFAKENWKNWQLLLEKIPRGLKLEKLILEKLVKSPNDFAGALRVFPKHIRKLYVHAYQSKIWNLALREIKKPKEKYYLPGYKVKLKNDKFSKEIFKLLKKDKLTLEDFKCKKMPELAVKGVLRKAIVKPKNLKILEIGKDDLNKNKYKLKISFKLPKGSYATTLFQFL